MCRNPQKDMGARTRFSRRRFIASSASLAASSLVTPLLEANGLQTTREFRSNWDSCPDRVWLGPEYWANPLQDWQIVSGRIECTNAAPDRNIHVLTQQLAGRDGTLATSVRVGRIGRTAAKRESAGFRIGAQGPLGNYRNNLIFGRGLDAGISTEGVLFVADVRGASSVPRDDVELHLTAQPAGTAYTVRLSARSGGKELGAVTKENVTPAQLVGNIALVCNFATPQEVAAATKAAPEGYGRCWFSDWRISGSKVEEHRDQAFGPILF
jgi:hypothetical protein